MDDLVDLKNFMSTCRDVRKELLFCWYLSSLIKL